MLSRPRFRVRPGAALLAVALAGALVACSEAGPGPVSPDEGTTAAAPPFEGWNLLVVLTDTMRADHLGTYGYERDTSPYLDQLADEGVVFARSYSASSYTRESVAALFTGLLPSTSGDGGGWWAHPTGAVLSLSEVFSEAGYRTGMFTSTVMLTDERYQDGFDEIDHVARRKKLKPSRAKMTMAVAQRAVDFIEADRSSPFFAYVHFLDPHAPYSPPEELHLLFADEVLEDRANLYSEVRPYFTTFENEGFGPGEARFEDMIARYDAEIRGVDRAVKAMIDALERLGEKDRTLLLLTSDHGEEFLDHGFVEHGWTLYEETTRVPLVLWAPARLAPARVDVPVSSVDVIPTLEGFFGLDNQTPASSRLAEHLDPALHAGRRSRFGDGTPLFDAELQPLADRDPVLLELLLPTRSVLRAVVHDGWKLIQVRRQPTPARRAVLSRDETLRAKKEAAGFDTFGEVLAEELFDLRRDPEETTNLLDQEPARAATLREILQAHESQALRLAPLRSAEVRAVEEDDEELQDDIRALGY